MKEPPKLSPVIIIAAPYGHVHKAGSLAEVNFLEISKNARKPHVLTLGITRASFSLREYSLEELNTPKREDHAGCKICLITLDCGTQLIIKYIKIRPDLTSCDKLPAKRITVNLPDPCRIFFQNCQT